MRIEGWRDYQHSQILGEDRRDFSSKVWSLRQHRRVQARLIYNENRHLMLNERFERILEFWLNQELFRLQPQSAQALLVEVLTEARCTPKVISIIEQKMSVETENQPAG